MKPIEKWWPHLYPKAKMIVSVTLDDGSIIQTDEAELRVYLKCLDDEREKAAFRRMGLPPPDESRAAGRAWVSVQASESASGPRKAVTKEEIVAFERQWKKLHPDATRGWRTAACLEFGVTAKTLNNRLKE